MSVSIAMQSKVTTTETLTGPFISAADSTVQITGMDESGTYDATTSVPITKVAAYEVTMSGGAATINLAALTGLTAEEVVDGTGLKVQFIKFKSKTTNANVLTVTRGASNGWGPDAAGSAFTIPMSPGQSWLMSGADAGQDVASGDRTIDVSGTGSQVLQIFVGLG